MSKYAPETHAWYFANLSISEICRITGKSRFVINRMRRDVKFDTPALKRLLAAHPIPDAPNATGDRPQTEAAKPTAKREAPAPTGTPAVPETNAAPDSTPASPEILGTVGVPLAVKDVQPCGKLLLVVLLTDATCDQAGALLERLAACESAVNEGADILLWQRNDGTKLPKCSDMILKRFARVEWGKAKTKAEPFDEQQPLKDLAESIATEKARMGYAGVVIVPHDFCPPSRDWILRYRKSYKLVLDAGHVAYRSDGFGGGLIVSPVTKEGEFKIYHAPLVPSQDAPAIPAPSTAAPAPVAATPSIVVKQTVSAPAVVEPPRPVSAPAFLTHPPAGTKLAILVATNRGIAGACLESIWRNLRQGGSEFGPRDVEIFTEGTYDTFMNRNRLAHRFLQSGIEWALTLDDDMILPCGDAPWFRRATGVKWPLPMSGHAADTFAAVPAINRLLWVARTQNRKVVGACYFDRHGHGTPMFAAGRENLQMKRVLNAAGPKDEQVLTAWAGTGALLVHRSVFMDIRAKRPQDAVVDAAAKPWLEHNFNYFSPIDDSGDDVSFCRRVREAGHEIVVDLATMCAHVGSKAFTNSAIP